MIDLNEYLSSFPGEKAGGKTYETELNEILLNSMSNSWSRQVYALWFDHETITKKTVNMFEHMEIEEHIYEGFVESSYKILLWQIPTVMASEGNERRICLVNYLP